MRRPWHRMIILAGLSLVLWGGWWAVAGFRFESGLSRARRLMDDHQFPEARRWLAQVGPRWANDPEIAYRLGVCEHAGGNLQAALAAWERAEPHSHWAGRAGLARAPHAGG